MKNMKIYALILLANILSSPAFAGGSTGGGTSTIHDGEPQLLDLAEDEVVDPKKTDVQPFDPREEPAFQKIVMERINQIEKRLPGNKALIVKTLDDVIGNTRFLFTNEALAETNDTCKMEQIEGKSMPAAQKENIVKVNRQQYNAGSEIFRGALLAHEIIMQKNHQPACSDSVRKAVRALINLDKRSNEEIVSDLFQDGLKLKKKNLFYMGTEQEAKEIKQAFFKAIGPRLNKFCSSTLHPLNPPASILGYVNSSYLEEIKELRKLPNEIYHFYFHPLSGNPQEIMPEDGETLRVLFERLYDAVALATPERTDRSYLVGGSHLRLDGKEKYLESHDFSTLLYYGPVMVNGEPARGEEPLSFCYNSKENAGFCEPLAKKIQAEECKIFDTWKNTDRSFAEIAGQMRTPYPTEPKPARGNENGEPETGAIKHEMAPL